VVVDDVVVAVVDGVDFGAAALVVDVVSVVVVALAAVVVAVALVAAVLLGIYFVCWLHIALGRP